MIARQPSRFDPIHRATAFPSSRAESPPVDSVELLSVRPVAVPVASLAAVPPGVEASVLPARVDPVGFVVAPAAVCAVDPEAVDAVELADEPPGFVDEPVDPVAVPELVLDPVEDRDWRDEPLRVPEVDPVVELE